MTKDIIIESPLVNQRKDTKYLKSKTEGRVSGYWASKSCAVCSLKMVGSIVSPKFYKVPVMKLIKDGLAIGGFIRGIGWKHQSIIDIAKKYDISMKRSFYKKMTEKRIGLKDIRKNIESGAPVIISINYKLDSTKGGHMVVVNGIRISGKNVIGYYIQDPDPNYKNHNYILTPKQVLDNWRGGLLFLDK